jgi:hypothetical protein
MVNEGLKKVTGNVSLREARQRDEAISVKLGIASLRSQ